MRPTPLARRMSDPITAALDLVDDALLASRHFNPAATRRTFSIAMNDISEAVVLPTLMRRLGEQAPEVSLLTSFPPAQELGASLYAGELDLALGFLPGLADDEIRHQTVHRGRFMCMLRHGHPLSESMSPDGLATVPHASVLTTGTGYETIRDQLDAQSSPIHTALEVSHFLALPAIVAATDLVITVPERIGELLDAASPVTLVPHPLDLPSYEIAIYWHRRLDRDAANRWLRARKWETSSAVWIGLDWASSWSRIVS